MYKRFINGPRASVADLMQGLTLNSSQVTQLAPSTGHNVAVRTEISDETQTRRVSVVSGGGSGHEPMAAGYVGQGMLAAAAAGGIFAAPSVPAIATMLDIVSSQSTGILVVVMNYQGDRINFGSAVDEFRQRVPTCPVEMVLVADDVAIPDAQQKRGIAGTIYVLKVAGAAADAGHPLECVAAIARAAAQSLASFGVALQPCTIPGQSKDSERLGADEIELGMGIHGEPGVERRSLASFSDSHFVDSLMAEVGERLDVALQAIAGTGSGIQTLALMINNLGGVSQAEMLIFRKAVANVLYTKNGTILNGHKYDVLMHTGAYMTSLEMYGVSVTCFLLKEDSSQMAEFLEAPTSCSPWNPGFKVHPPSELRILSWNESSRAYQLAPRSTETISSQQASGGGVDNSEPGHESSTGEGASGSGLSTAMERCILGVTGSLLKHCSELETLDRKTGDGDFGNTVREGCEKIRGDLANGKYASGAGNPSLLLNLVASSVGTMEGTSGVLTGVFLRAAANSFESEADATASSAWRRAFGRGTDALMEKGEARVGSRTMVDALYPASQILQDATKTVAEASQAARDGCESTARMRHATSGRSAGVRAESLEGIQDPGARAVWIIMDALADGLTAH